ncbi:hypothetical protein LOTGIDRAFT_229539 [Lottia gigantea]|uniref:Heme-binding protein 2-like n=1 Tax=Lottia gigantea TaxID=225164 RepID=V3ZIE8_LOTGI|nr:hypothetical protein LOTGIDRAFT_229539 [Lottia gigantea]ESO83982.1 hypothetical protein LOTGIDRAFT_229539 [Lottia gigantea]
MMLKVISLILALQLLNTYCAAYSLDAYGKPSFCKQHDCPSFTRLFEVRQYEASNWVETEEINMPYETAKRVMFWKLFGYISGNNADGQKINMTAPVLSKHNKNTNSYTMMFYLPNSISNPPQPIDPSVKLSSFPASLAYVRSFSGYARSKDDWVAQETILAQALLSNGVAYDKSSFYTAGYDGPGVQDRHNEVWLLPPPYYMNGLPDALNV